MPASKLARGAIRNVPLAVLVDEGTASGAEIVGVGPDVFVRTQDPEIEQGKAIDALRKARH